MKPACLYIPNLRSKRLMTSIQQRTCGMDRNLGNCLRLDIKKFGIAYSFWNRMLDQKLACTCDILTEMTPSSAPSKSPQ